MAYVAARAIVYPIFRSRLTSIEGVEHLPRNGPYVIASNHIDFLDGFFISCAVYDQRKHHVSFLSKSRNYWWTRSTIPINTRSRSHSLDAALLFLKNGGVICNFIEGSRNRGSTLLPGKTGTARLALAANVPVIPVGISGPAGRFFAESLTNLLMNGKGGVQLHFGPAVDLAPYRSRALEYETLQSATRDIMHAIVPLSGKLFVG